MLLKVDREMILVRHSWKAKYTKSNSDSLVQVLTNLSSTKETEHQWKVKAHFGPLRISETK